jgi:hypothetical protein
MLLLACLLCGCAAGGNDLAEIDPAAAPANPTWTENIQPLMERYCTACHDPDEQGGTQHGVDLSTCPLTRQQRHSVEEVVFDSKSMPPGGADRLRSWEQLMLRRWYDQGATCE